MNTGSLMSILPRQSILLFFLAIATFTLAAGDATLGTSALNRPNLIPSNVGLSSYSIRPGDLLTITYTMTNAGSGHCPASFTGLHIGTSPTVRPSNDPLNLTFTTPEIPPNTAIRQTNTVTVPFDLSFGTYYIWVVADDVSSSTLNQTSRADDVTRSSPLSVSSVRVQPNIVPINITLNNPNARPGDDVTVTWAITNKGNIMCPSSLTGIRLGTSATVPPGVDAAIVPTPDIAGHGAVTQSTSITLPNDITLGTYYLWVIADNVSVSTLNQSSRADDIARSPALIVARPNLVPQNVTLNTYQARRNDQVTVNWTVSNTGDADCPASQTGLHIGTSATVPPTGDALNLRLATPAIPAKSSTNQTSNIIIPGGLAFGTYYIWVVADDVAVSTLKQSSKTDDAARSPALAVVAVVVRPNLIPQSVALNASQARIGDQLTIRWTMTNAGNGSCPASITGLHLGTSSNTPPTSDALNLKVNTPALAAGAVVHQTNTITIPAGTAVGRYYIWVIADDVAESTLDQSSRADDATPSPGFDVVTVLRQPNLVPLNPSLSTQLLRPGDQVTLSWTMTNSGNANCPPSSTGIRLSQSSTVKPTTDPLAIALPTPEIKTNASLAQTHTVTIPANTAPGTYYLWVIADDVTNSTLNQSSRADDAKPSPSFQVVTVLPQPNLVPHNIILSSAFVAPGGQLTVAWNIANTGNANCPASTTGVYLSQSSTTRPTTGAVKLSIPTPAINAGFFVRQTNTFTVPANTPVGTYYVWIVADDVANSTLNQSSRDDDALRSDSIVIGSVALTSPAASETVSAPPTFTWTGTTTARVYLATKSAPIPGVDSIFIFNNPPGTTTFRPSGTEWAGAVADLGLAQDYYWTVGSANEAQPEIYAGWRPFRINPVALGGTIVTAGASREFRLQVVAPHQSQVVLQATDSLGGSWTDLPTLQNSTGVVTYTDTTVDTRSARFFRVKP